MYTRQRATTPTPCSATAQSELHTRRRRPAAVLFVVQDGERNAVDQRMLEYALWDDHRLPVLRCSLGMLSRACAPTEGGMLVVEGPSKRVLVSAVEGPLLTPSDHAQ